MKKKNFIQNLQNKSDNQKKKILIVCLVILMTLVIMVWILQMKNYSLPKDGIQLPPISDIKNEVVDIYNNSAEKVKNIKENLNNIQ